MSRHPNSFNLGSICCPTLRSIKELTLLVNTGFGEILTIDLESMQILDKVNVYNALPSSFYRATTVSPDQNTLAVSAPNGKVILYNIAENKLDKINEIEMQQRVMPTSLKFIEENVLLVGNGFYSLSGEKFKIGIEKWDFKVEPNILDKLILPGTSVDCIIDISNNEYLVACIGSASQRDSQLAIFDSRSFKIINYHVITGVFHDKLSLLDGRHIVSCGDKSIGITDLSFEEIDYQYLPDFNKTKYITLEENISSKVFTKYNENKLIFSTGFGYDLTTGKIETVFKNNYQDKVASDILVINNKIYLSFMSGEIFYFDM